TPMTRILRKACPWYVGLNQLVTILMALALATVRLNTKTPKSVARFESNCLITTSTLPISTRPEEDHSVMENASGREAPLDVPPVGKFARPVTTARSAFHFHREIRSCIRGA